MIVESPDNQIVLWDKVQFVLVKCGSWARSFTKSASLQKVGSYSRFGLPDRHPYTPETIPSGSIVLVAKLLINTLIVNWD